MDAQAMAQVAQRGLQPKQMADAEHRLCYTDRMLKRSLTRTNPYLRDPVKRREIVSDDRVYLYGY